MIARLTELVAHADVPGAGPFPVVGPVGGHLPALAGADDVVDARRRAGDEGRHHGREEQQREAAFAPLHLFNEIDPPAGLILVSRSMDDSYR